MNVPNAVFWWPEEPKMGDAAYRVSTYKLAGGIRGMSWLVSQWSELAML